MILILIAIGWFICAFISTGFQVAYFQRHWWDVRTRSDLAFCIVWSSILGPAALVIGYINADHFRYGWTLRASDGPWTLAQNEQHRIDREAAPWRNHE